MSTTTDRRQQRREQLRREREAEILRIARRMLVQGGYLGLNIDRIAEELGYAKGTIYNHFCNKEEIMLALAVETSGVRRDMFERAARFTGRTRERLSAIGVASELFVRLYPDHFNVEQLLRASSIWEKTSPQRRHVMRDCELRCIGIVTGVIREAADAGDMPPFVELTPQALAFGLWSVVFGGYSIISTSDSLAEMGLSDPYLAIRDNIHRMLDGYQWRPLSGELDYATVWQRACLEVFPNEHRAALAH